MRYASITERLAGLGSGKWDLHLRGRKLAAGGAPLVELTIGEPDLPPDPALIDACTAAMHAGRTRYSDGRGEPGLLAVLADRYARRSGREVRADNILCFPGTQSALFAVMYGLVEPGDGVLVPDPYYATYEGVVRAPGGRFVPVATHAAEGFRLSASALEAAVTPDCRVLLLNSPHNPSGAVLTRDEIAAIGEVCRRHDLWIVSDEVYEELVFDGIFASPFDIPELASRTVAVSSISKSHAAPGFRSGWAAGPAEFCERLLPFSESMLFGNQPFIADMTALALAGGSRTAATMRASYKARATMMAERLNAVEGLSVLPPQAGMFVLVDVGGTGLDGHAFAERLLEKHFVSVMPGASFGNAAKDMVRVSLTVPDERLAEACDRIAAFVRDLPGSGSSRARDLVES